MSRDDKSQTGLFENEARQIKDSILKINSVILDVPSEHPSVSNLTQARASLELAYAKLKGTCTKPATQTRGGGS